MKNNLFTSESVTEGHPDKVCDQISDAILDAYLAVDPDSRVACEVCASKKNVMIMGEITSKGKVNIEKIAREKIKEIGYDSDELGFNGENINIILDISEQSPDIALGVDKFGAGDQGMMFGYATNEIEGALMPAAIYYAHLLAKRLTEVRRKGIIKYLRPDGKSQVTVKYKDGKFVGIDTILISTQHDPSIANATIREDIIDEVIRKVIPKKYFDEDVKVLVNPTGSFVIGGPIGDSGLTGRKIIVDTYGGAAPHGGGAFSGKDATKVDRSGAYYARYVAKNLVAAGLCDKCQIQVAYAIGVEEPVSINVNTFSTGKVDDEKILGIINKVFDFRPQNIIDELELKEPVFGDTAKYGHFGWDNYSWEKINKIDEIKQLI